MKIVALIPGSFKPAHWGHYDMIKWYSKASDEVIVVLSDPKKPRTSKGGIVIPAVVAKKILEIYCETLPNVRIELVKGSPINWCIEYTEKVEDSTMFYLGCSSKGEDGNRGEILRSHIPNRHMVVVEDFVFDAGKEAISATDFRNTLDTKEDIDKFLPKHLTPEQKNKVKELLVL